MAKTIITIGREYCTGGRFIAEDVAQARGAKLYDKELITLGGQALRLVGGGHCCQREKAHP